MLRMGFALSPTISGMRILFPLVLLLSTACSTPAPVCCADHAGAEAQVVLKTSQAWDGSAYAAYPAGRPELTLVRMKIAPHAVLPWHTHPMPNVAYVVAGTLRVEKRGTGETRDLKAGDALPELVGVVHRGVAGDQGVELLVFYAGAQGLPLKAVVVP